MGCLSNGRLRMSGRMSDRPSHSGRPSILGKDSRGRGTSETMGSVRNVRELSECIQGTYTRVHQGRDAAVRRDLRSSRTCASSPCYVLAPGADTTIAGMSGSHRRYNSHRLLLGPLESSSAKYVVPVTDFS